MSLDDKLPVASKICTQFDHYDYTDSYSLSLKRSDVESWELIPAFFLSVPKWVDRLMLLRNGLVSLVGLKTGSGKPGLAPPPYAKGQEVGVFQIQEISENEVILGQDDKHLDFKTSLLLERDKDSLLVVSMAIHMNNFWGRLYFSAVKPIHRIIVPGVVKSMGKNIDEKLLPIYSDT
jgi:hypothetical protein